MAENYSDNLPKWPNWGSWTKIFERTVLGAKKIAVDNYNTNVDGSSTNKDDNLANSLISAIEKEMESDNRKNARIYSLLATQVIQDPYGKGRKRYNAFKFFCPVDQNSSKFSKSTRTTQNQQKIERTVW